jgi:hypothetical protein
MGVVERRPAAPPMPRVLAPGKPVRLYIVAEALEKRARRGNLLAPAGLRG